MLRKFKIPIIVVITVLLNQAAGYVVQAAVPDSFRPLGATRYAMVSATDQISTTSASFVDMPGMSTSITIPTGKRGDIMILFCATTLLDFAGTDMHVQAMVGGSPATPNNVYFHGGPVEVESRCATFYKLNKPAGTTNVKIQWNKTGNALGTAYVWYYRAMIVTVNLHD